MPFMPSPYFQRPIATHETLNVLVLSIVCWPDNVSKAEKDVALTVIHEIEHSLPLSGDTEIDGVSINAIGNVTFAVYSW